MVQQLSELKFRFSTLIRINNLSISSMNSNSIIALIVCNIHKGRRSKRTS